MTKLTADKGKIEKIRRSLLTKVVCEKGILICPRVSTSLSFCHFWISRRNIANWTRHGQKKKKFITLSSFRDNLFLFFIFFYFIVILCSFLCFSFNHPPILTVFSLSPSQHTMSAVSLSRRRKADLKGNPFIHFSFSYFPTIQQQKTILKYKRKLTLLSCFFKRHW